MPYGTLEQRRKYNTATLGRRRVRDKAERDRKRRLCGSCGRDNNGIYGTICGNCYIRIVGKADADPDPVAREARIQKYEERAAAGLPLFD